MTEHRPLITRWFPAATIGAESLRDVSAGQQPPPNRLHVWWSRKPLTTARAAVVATVLPAWNDSEEKQPYDHNPTGFSVDANPSVGSGGSQGESRLKCPSSSVLPTRVVVPKATDPGQGSGAGRSAASMDRNQSLPPPSDIQALLNTRFGSEAEYRRWFLEAIGIKGDPVAVRSAIVQAKVQGVHLGSNPYGYRRAFTTTPDEATRNLIHRLFNHPSFPEGGRPPVVLDPFGGGGSIPFEAARYGCHGLTTELNPVATAILTATTNLPFIHRMELKELLTEYGEKLVRRIQSKLSGFFHHVNGETIRGYVWALTVPCPTTGHPTPLLPNHWLARTAQQKVAIKLYPDSETGEISIELIDNATVVEGSQFTYRRGAGTSVFTGDTFDGKYIATEARAGRIGTFLRAVAYRPANGRGTQFRVPVDEDFAALDETERFLKAKWDEWDTKELIPTELIPDGNKTSEPQRYGMPRWCDLFTPRQLVTVVTAVECLHEVLEEASVELDLNTLKALNLYLAFAIDKVVDYNSRLTMWDPTYLKVAHVFTQHNFAMSWTFAEMEGVDACRWGLKQIVDCYRDISKLVGTAHAPNGALLHDQVAAPILPAESTLASATALPYEDQSVDAIVTDPPYYDNIMYAELSDYFYVWLKRSLKPYWPELCQQPLADKDNEAVSNRSRFADMATHSGRGKKPPGAVTAQELAEDHYQSMIARAFSEAYRVLRDSGAMTVMFTHKRADAWNALATGLLNAGFRIESSWPVSTESEHSLHQKGKNAANATILLTCTKRGNSEPAWWDDIQAEVREAAHEAAIRHAEDGLAGVDVTLASFGSVLSVLSRHWPVYTGNLDPDGNRQVISPEVVLDLAREEVGRTKIARLLQGRQEYQFDPPTQWWLLAWHDFGAPKFPASEAIKLSHATHLDLETELRKGWRLVETKSGTAEILTPARRFEARAFQVESLYLSDTWIDRLHALMVIHEQDGAVASRQWLGDRELDQSQHLKELVDAALKVVPRHRNSNGELALPEARTLESMHQTLDLFHDLEPPAPGTVQMDLYS